ncbi:hypothetical protein NC661_06305 [Aquibacillus koreensis]|uniref:RsgI N-terminal anti-sigma domain-containing protein n=1 Tax=Aquibacillus koreensis TaxID=279446 RepID=A0A9X4AHH7_9BACI|nr:hypothetical protein [Aquibacillus koreensis]MCT2536642.1 hypothetical protein [Aquibacillus koreensis]MDC3419981.1 hypothetical protein [Aquibacillus koreensis]
MKSTIYNGIVVKVTEESIIILCEGGMFKNVPRPTDEVPKIGDTYTYVEKKGYSFRGAKYITLASVICLAIITYYVSSLFTNEEDAYLFAMDINPSLEIYTDDDFRVTHMEFLNEDGRTVIDTLSKEKRHIDEVLDDIIQISVEKRYLNQTKKGLVALTVVPLKEPSNFETEKVKRSVEKSVLNRSISADVSVKSGTKDLVQQSHNENLSINKYSMYKELEEKQVDVTVEEVRDHSMGSVLERVSRLEEQDVEDGKEVRNKRETSSENKPEMPSKDKSKTAEHTDENQSNDQQAKPASGKETPNRPVTNKDKAKDKFEKVKEKAEKEQEKKENLEEKGREAAEKEREKKKKAEEKAREEEEKEQEVRKKAEREREAAEKEQEENKRAEEREREEAGKPQGNNTQEKEKGEPEKKPESTEKEREEENEQGNKEHGRP